MNFHKDRQGSGPKVISWDSREDSRRRFSNFDRRRRCLLLKNSKELSWRQSSSSEGYSWRLSAQKNWLTLPPSGDILSLCNHKHKFCEWLRSIGTHLGGSIAETHSSCPRWEDWHKKGCHPEASKIVYATPHYLTRNGSTLQGTGGTPTLLDLAMRDTCCTLLWRQEKRGRDVTLSILHYF